MANGQQVQADPLGSGQSQDRGEHVELAAPSRRAAPFSTRSISG